MYPPLYFPTTLHKSTNRGTNDEPHSALSVNPGIPVPGGSKVRKSGWWFGTFLPYIGNDDPI